MCIYNLSVYPADYQFGGILVKNKNPCYNYKNLIVLVFVECKMFHLGLFLPCFGAGFAKSMVPAKSTLQSESQSEQSTFHGSLFEECFGKELSLVF